MHLRSLISEARYQAHKAKTNAWHAIGRAVPDRVAYWVFVAQGAKHIGGPNHPHEVVTEVPFMTVYGRLADSLAHNCKPRDEARTGELRRCTECGKWWRKNPYLSYHWDRVMPWHIKERAAIRQHEAKMLTLVEAEREVEDR